MVATVVRRNRIAFALSVLGVGLALLVLILAAVGLLHGDAAWSLMWNILFYTLIPFAVWWGFYVPKRRRAEVIATLGLLHAKDDHGVIELAADRARIDRMRDGRYRVSVRRGTFARLRVEVDTEEQAREIVTKLGVDRREGTTQFVVQGTFGKKTKLTVGHDGIQLESRGKREFIRHADIRSVVRTMPAPPIVVSPGVQIELADGRRLYFDTRKTRFEAEVWETDPVYDAIEKGRASVSASAAATTLLERGNRSASEWLEAIRAVADGRTDYRSVALDDRQLETVLGDAQAPKDARIAAALALRVRDPARLRIAIEDVADEGVRDVALADENHIEAKLHALGSVPSRSGPADR